MSHVFELSLKRILRQRLMLAMMLAIPVAITLIPQPEQALPLIGFSLFGLVLLFSAFLLTKQVLEDRQYRTIIRIAAAPITHRDYLLGHLGAYLVVMMIQIVVFWGLAIILWSAPITFYLWAFSLLVFFALLSLSFSLFWHTLFKTYATSIGVYSVVANLLALLGGMTYPLAFMPDQMRSIVIILPTYWYAYGFELLAEARYASVLLSLLILLGFAIIFLTIGSKRRLQ